MTDDHCRLHRGQPAHNCACCRSERIADPAAEPERLRPAPRPKRARTRRFTPRREATP